MRIFVRDKNFYKRFFVMSLTIALQNLVVSSVNLADNVMLGGYSESALSAVALVNQFQFLLQMFAIGLGDGVVVLASQYWGKRNMPVIRRIVSISVWIGVVASILFWAVALFFPDACIRLFTNDEALVQEGIAYMQIMSFTYLIFTVSNILVACLRSVETVRIGFITSVIALVVNVCLNYMLIYGHFGAPRLGVRGAAIATLISRVVEFAIVLIYTLFMDKKICMKLKDFLVFDKGLFRDFIRSGLPVIMTNAFWGIAMAVQTAILGRMSASVVAANSIATTVFQVLTVLAFAPASASAVLIGKTIGENKLDLEKQYSKTLQVLYLFIGCATALLLLLSKDLILGFYNVSEETAELSRQLINILSIIVIGAAYQVPVGNGIVRGGGDTKYSFIVDTLFMWLLVIPSAALSAFVFHFPPIVTFICLKCDQGLKCIPAFIKVNFCSWTRQLTR